MFSRTHGDRCRRLPRPTTPHGSAARQVLHAATGPAVAAVAAVWFVRRGRRHSTGALAEAACPARLGPALLAERPAGVRAVIAEGAAPGPALEPR